MHKEVYPHCAGLDVHKKFVTACRVAVDEQGVTHTERRKFATMSAYLQDIADWLAVAMESMGVYWQPIYNIFGLAGLGQNAAHWGGL